MVNEKWGLVERQGKHVARPPGSPTPCWKCPKCNGEKVKSPAVGRKSELSDKNYRTLQLYYRALIGDPLPGADDITRRNLGIIRELFDAHDRSQRQALIQLTAAKR